MAHRHPPQPLSGGLYSGSLAGATRHAVKTRACSPHSCAATSCCPAWRPMTPSCRRCRGGRRALQRHRPPPRHPGAVAGAGTAAALAATIMVGGPCRWWTPSRQRTPTPPQVGAWPEVGPTHLCCAGQHADADQCEQRRLQAQRAAGDPECDHDCGAGNTIARANGAPKFRLLEVHSTGDLKLGHHREWGCRLYVLLWRRGC